MTDATVATQMKETIIAPIKEAEGGHEMSTGQELRTLTWRACISRDYLATIKIPHVLEKSVPRKKMKASKTSVDPIMLTEGDLFDIGEMVHDVTKEALREVMME